MGIGKIGYRVKNKQFLYIFQEFFNRNINYLYFVYNESGVLVIINIVVYV